MKPKIKKQWKSGNGYRYILICNNCGNEFEVTGKRFNSDPCLYCTTKCSNSSKEKINKDNKSKSIRYSNNKRKYGKCFKPEAIENIKQGTIKRFSNPEERRKISTRVKMQYKQGRQNPKGMLGKIPWNKGKENPLWKGSNNPNWNNGSSYEPYGIEFNNQLKEKIRKRYNYTCQECNKLQKDLGYKLPIHHIDYNKKNNQENNLISLCRKCHSKTNFNRKDWIKYFIQKMI